MSEVVEARRSSAERSIEPMEKEMDRLGVAIDFVKLVVGVGSAAAAVSLYGLSFLQLKYISLKVNPYAQAAFGIASLALEVCDVFSHVWVVLDSARRESRSYQRSTGL